MNTVPTSPILTHAVKYTWEELQRAAADLITEKAAQEAKKAHSTIDAETVITELLPVVCARVREELDLVLELTLKNARTRLKKEIESRIEDQVRNALKAKIEEMEQARRA